jgi:hypothetical protein
MIFSFLCFHKKAMLIVAARRRSGDWPRFGFSGPADPRKIFRRRSFSDIPAIVDNGLPSEQERPASSRNS